jgi:hypothetical protein
MSAGVLGPVNAALPHLAGDVTRVRVVLAEGARAAPFVAALADETDVVSVERAAHALVVTGKELVAVAAAVTRAIAAAGVDVEAIEPQIVSLDLLRKAPA